MPAYNFQARFADLVERGFKDSTIRAKPAVVGTTAYLFTGMRTKACRRLGQGLIFDCRYITLRVNQNRMPRVIIEGGIVNEGLLHGLANREGFENGREMVDWFKTTYKQSMPSDDGGVDYFKGHLIFWDLQSQGEKA